MADEKEISFILKDHCRFQGLESRKPSPNSLGANLGVAEEEEFYGVFFKPGIGLVKFKLSAAGRELLSTWFPTDDIRLYEMVDPEQPKIEQGFYNPRLDRRFPVSSIP
jgi:hypothetical protein